MSPSPTTSTFTSSTWATSSTVTSTTSTHGQTPLQTPDSEYTFRWPWEPIPYSPPLIPDLQTLAILNIRGETLLNSSLRDIIIKAQPHHSQRTLLHLTREQLIQHVDALVQWWKMANPQKAVQFGVVSGDGRIPLIGWGG